MSMNLNITTSSSSTSSMSNSRPVVSISTAKPVSSSNNSHHHSSGISPSGAHVVVDAVASSSSSGLPPIAHVHSTGSSGRKRKSSHSKKPPTSNNNNKERDAESSSAAAAGAVATGPSPAVGKAKSTSPFEKLNTLKLLLDCGHLTADEYHERKTQIINEMTGTSTERKKPSPRRVLQPLMKTVVPHNPPDFSRLLQERAEKLSFDVDTLEWHATTTRIKLDLVPFATGQLRNAYYLQVWTLVRVRRRWHSPLTCLCLRTCDGSNRSSKTAPRTRLSRACSSQSSASDTPSRART